MTDDELITFEGDITAICAEHRRSHWRNFDYRACVSFESKESKYFIKFDNPRTLWPEFSTQSYIYDYAKRHGNGPRIPHALHYFETQETAFLVMEHIRLRDEHPPDLAERTAVALNWLSEVPSPSEDLMGPIGGGLIHHSFFKNNKAPLAFSSIDALERYMNEVRRCIHFFEYLQCDNILFGQGRKLLSDLAMNPVEPIIIINDPLIFTQSDMHISNFGVDRCGNTVLLDFGQIGRLPLSFAKYAMGSDEDGGFVAQVANLLCWPENSNMISMARVSSCLWTTSNPKLGVTGCA
jgi:hypothetical protein